MTYAGMIHYEEKGAQDLVTFSVAKNLNSLLQVCNSVCLIIITILPISSLMRSIHLLKKDQM